MPKQHSQTATTLMRSFSNETAPLDAESTAKMISEHIPYRLSLLRDGHRKRTTPLSQITNQSFEAGAISGRILLSFLGLIYDRRGSGLINDRNHTGSPLDKNKTDDVKAPDINGKYIEIRDLPKNEEETLGRFLRVVNKGCAHFTMPSTGGLDIETYDQSAAIIFRLMFEQFPEHCQKWPTWEV